ncbi:MAG: hydrogenase maturation protease [Planctomycetes bacterium]|nr:hydrogenase maturation protease [Planctomycetota bacterium]
MNKETIVLGLGNPLMGDEGIGIKLIEMLQSASGDFPEADFVDAGTGGMSLLHLISDRRKAVIIDCAHMGTEPGTIRQFTPDHVKTVKQLTHLSLHEVDIIKVIDLARQLGECPEEIIFFGIEPETVTQQMELSNILTDRLAQYIETIKTQL